MRLLVSKRSHVCSRAARAIANLAKDHENMVIFLGLSIVSSLLTMLSQTSETDPQQCGLRALHIFLLDTSSHETFFKREGIKIVLSSLKSPDPVVISSALKVVERMSWFDAFAKQLRDIDSGYDTLLNLTLHINPKIQHAALHSLLLCSKFSDCCSSIATPDGIGLFLRHLEQIQDVEMKSFVGQILCCCCWNVLCRNWMIQCMGVAKMIKMLGESEFHRLHDKLLSALMCYYYNEPALKEMANMGLVTVLIKTLSSIVEIELLTNVDDPVTERRTNPIEEIQANMEDEQLLSVSDTKIDGVVLEISAEEEQVDFQLSASDEITSVSDVNKQSGHVYESDIQQLCVSDTDKQQTSSDINKQLSSTNICKFSGSPSPIGYRQFFDSSPLVGVSPPSDLSSPCSPDASSPTSPEPISPQFPQAGLTSSTPTVIMHPIEQKLLSLLSRISLIKECIPAFLSQDVLKVLVGYVQCSPHPHPKAMRILHRLAENRGCFEHLILQQAVPMIYHQFCLGERCSTGVADNRLHGYRLMNSLRYSAKSGYGQGLLAHKLIRGSEKEVKWYALSLPYLCESKEVCQKLCIKYKGLECLINLVRQGILSEQEIEFAVCGLGLLAKNLLQSAGLSEVAEAPPAKRMNLKDIPDKEESDCSCYYEDAIRQADLESKDLIKLRLDGGKIIICCQDVLINRSDYFHAMFLGSFRECNAQCVDLPDVDYQALLAVVHSLHGCSWTCKTVISDNPSADPKTKDEEDNHRDYIDMVCSLGLGVIALSNQFLLTDLSEECQSVVSRYISGDNLAELFHFSCMHSATLLNIRCVQQWLEMSDLQLQIQILHQIMDSQDNEALLSRITDLLSNKVTLGI